MSSHSCECKYLVLYIARLTQNLFQMGLIKEFRDFAMRGNVVDLAVGVIIGGAFGGIVNSLVGDILMPLLGVISGGVNFNDRSIEIGDAIIAYGKFIQAIISFLIIAFALFMVIKGMNSLKKKEDAAPAPVAPEPSKEEKLLAEIRDLLKERR
jgi:large conductance mechanosensitive channel